MVIYKTSNASESVFSQFCFLFDNAFKSSKNLNLSFDLISPKKEHIYVQCGYFLLLQCVALAESSELHTFLAATRCNAKPRRALSL
jgi:hypothetical protein